MWRNGNVGSFVIETDDRFYRNNLGKFRLSRCKELDNFQFAIPFARNKKKAQPPELPPKVRQKFNAKIVQAAERVC